MPMPEDIFGADFLRQLQTLDQALLRLRGSAGEGIARHGRSHGQHDFRGHRPYAPGDDLRRLDWNAYGRLGKYFLREFERERAEHVTLLVDTSRSMAPGRKHVLARRAAAAVGYLALARGGTATLAGGVLLQGQARFSRLVEELRELEPVQDSMAPALVALASRPKAPSDLFVVTDGLDLPESFRPLAALSQRRCQVTLLLVLAPQELEPPTHGSVQLHGLEERQNLAMELTPERVMAYQAALESHLQSLQALALRNRWTLAVTDSQADLVALFTEKLAGVLA